MGLLLYTDNSPVLSCV